MIPRPNIARWKEFAPWSSFDQIEQDLIISRTLVEIFSDKFLNDNLAFRGGTALHKLYLNPAPRYSEDIDLVQIKPGPIKPIMEKINEVIKDHAFQTGNEMVLEMSGHSNQGFINVGTILYLLKENFRLTDGFTGNESMPILMQRKV